MSNQTNHQLNLARKWRPQTFDHIVGQQAAITMLKNSLYLQKYFPVYLFSGQRGCGKTTTARVFAAALNCLNLSAFHANPKNTTIPCLTCKSCLSMQTGNHADFIEIDAASHTGVDNVRQIIEASSYVPLVGQKKIYLIDEAHMLSKAAFNAFLKVLEEPPPTVHFLLATTEIHKIPQTVLSRCFQLTFNAIDQESLYTYLDELCKKETIQIERDALNLIIAETEGSARDALNLLEQVRFSSSEEITEIMVLQLLGKMSSSTIIEVFEHVVFAQPEKLLITLQQVSKQHILPQATWNMLVELSRVILWLKHGIEDIPAFFSKHFERLLSLAAACSFARLHCIMQFLWEQEPLFMQTKQKQPLLEHTLVQLCYQTDVSRIDQVISTLNQGGTIPTPTAPSTLTSTLSSTMAPAAAPSPSPVKPSERPPESLENSLPKPSSSRVVEVTPRKEINGSPVDPQWATFIQDIKTIDDLLLHSILMQAEFINFNQDTGVITIGLSNNSAFFKDKLVDTSELWKPLLLAQFPAFKEFFFQELKNQPKLTRSATITQPPPRNVTSSKIAAPPAPSRGRGSMPGNNRFKAPARAQETFITVNVSDTGKWPLSNLLITHFPGKIVREKSYS